MRILLTGASGRLAVTVHRELLRTGHEVVPTDCLHRPGIAGLRIVDLLDRSAVYGLLEGCDAVVHLGNHADMGRVSPPQRLYSENVTMNANVFHAAIEMGIRRLIFASSIQAISGDRVLWQGGEARPTCLPYLPLDEHVPACPGNLYGLSKANTELMLWHYCRLDPSLSCTAIRFPSLWKAEWIEHYREHHSAPGKLDEAFTYLEVQDAARLVSAVLVAGRPGYIHFVPSARNNYLGWSPAEIIRRFYPGIPLKRPAETMPALVDLAPLQQAYGWAPQVALDMPRWEG